MVLSAIKNKILRRKIKLQQRKEELQPFHGGETGGLSVNFYRLKSLGRKNKFPKGKRTAANKNQKSKNKGKLRHHLFLRLKWISEDVHNYPKRKK